MPCGKLRDIGHPVGHTSADGVEALELGLRRDMFLDIVDDAVELIQRLCGLGIEVDVMVEVEFFDFLETLDDNGRTLGLAHEA